MVADAILSSYGNDGIDVCSDGKLSDSEYANDVVLLCEDPSKVEFFHYNNVFVGILGAACFLYPTGVCLLCLNCVFILTIAMCNSGRKTADNGVCPTI